MAVQRTGDEIAGSLLEKLNTRRNMSMTGNGNDLDGRIGFLQPRHEFRYRHSLNACIDEHNARNVILFVEIEFSRCEVLTYLDLGCLKYGRHF